MLLYITFLLSTLFLLLYKYFTNKFDYWKKRNVFFLKPKPFIGNLLDFMSKESMGHSLRHMCKLAGYRDFFGIFVFNRPILLVTSPKIIRSILQRDFSSFADRTVANTPRHPVMSHLLFFQRNPIWKEVRAKLNPLFTSGKLKAMFPLMEKECKEMTDYISTIANIPNIEAKEICAKLSTNIITRCAFAVEAHSFLDEDAIFRKLGRQMFDFRISTAVRQFGSFFTPALFEWLNIMFWDPKILDGLKGIFINVLNIRNASANLKGNDFVDILLENNRKSGGNGFSEQAMLGQAIQMFAAGFETVSSTLSYALYELCINPDVQEKLRMEITKYLEKNNEITYETLHDMKYLDMVITESLRKYPPVPFLDRKCLKDYKIEGTDLIIEKETSLYIPIYTLHYNPKYFPNPEKFDPDRYEKSSLNQDGLYYLAFGEGPRICIGQRFGLMEAKIGLVSILSKYRLERSSLTPEPIEYEVMSIVVQSKVGIPLKFVPL